MILWISIIYIIHLNLSESSHESDHCLSGYMTDLQSWVTKDGKLIINDTRAIDVSYKENVVSVIGEYMQNDGRLNILDDIKYLSVAKCRLQRVPPIFTLQGGYQSPLSESVEYVTFYGNIFGKAQETGTYESFINATNAKEVSVALSSNERSPTWAAGLRNVKFLKLRQLDLRACKIEALDAFIFQGMPNLTHLYLGENEITYIHAHAFVGLRNIFHMDISRNVIFYDINPASILTFESMDTFAHLNLTSLDLSFTPLSMRHIQLLGRLGNMLESLSMCHTAVFKLRRNCFGSSPLTYLDVSNNSNALSDDNILEGLEDTLRVLYAQSILLRSIHYFKGFKKLEILKLANNEIAELPKNTLETLQNLQVLDLTNNRISTWYFPVFSRIPRLKLLSLAKNNVNLISDLMVNDLSNINYLSLTKNSMICHCLTREIYEVAYQNELIMKAKPLEKITKDDRVFHAGYLEYNNMIKQRNNLTTACLKIHDPETRLDCYKGIAVNSSGNYLFLDYEPESYSCLALKDGTKTPMFKEPSCSHYTRDMPDVIVATQNSLMLLLILLIILPILGFFYVFRRNFRYFLITIRNSAMLSLINEKDVNDGDNKLFNYDVFVSYCNEDRVWVLDHLLPHVEIDCNISVCLHERDFQVGLSILENIVSCMDRSRSIMLIISKRFLLSQWCQFEMHLAQHRLLETRREDLILILLEEIPRRLRPNTLHYLMLTKTYIVWPKDESETKEFWKRMKKSLDTQKLKNVANDSLA